jgi:hypothetical protein
MTTVPEPDRCQKGLWHVTMLLAGFVPVPQPRP